MRQSKCEEGSVTPLIVCYFLISTLLIFLISDVATAYSERRRLTAQVEAALALSAQELDRFSYYYGGPLTEYLAANSVSRGELFVPIDCEAARETFLAAMEANENDYQATLDKPFGPIEIRSFSCDGKRLTAEVFGSFELPFQMPVFEITHFSTLVKAGITSSYR